MSFIKFPKRVAASLISDTSVPVHYRVFVHLSAHCDYATGIIHPTTASAVASAVGCHRTTVYSAIRKLRDLGWFTGDLSTGCLTGFKSRPYKSAAEVRRQSNGTGRKSAARGNPVKKTSARDRRDTQTFGQAMSRWQSNIPDKG